MLVKKITLGLLLCGAVMNNAASATCGRLQSDIRIEKSVDQAFDNSAYLDDHVHFRVDEGVVTLTGKVDTLSQKNQATQLASSVANVKEVDNRIEVK